MQRINNFLMSFLSRVLFAILHCTMLHCTILHCTMLHCTMLHCTILHCTILHCTILHCTIQMIKQFFRTSNAHILQWNISEGKLNHKYSPISAYHQYKLERLLPLFQKHVIFTLHKSATQLLGRFPLWKLCVGVLNLFPFCVPINIFGKYLKKDEGFQVLHDLRSVLNYLLSLAI